MEDNHIAFKLQLDHLLNVLHAASAEKAESMIMKLVVRNVYGHSSGEISGSRAMLTFTWRRSDMEMEQEIPVGAPCRGNSLASLCTLCDPSSPCPFYIDFLPVLSELTVRWLLALTVCYSSREIEGLITKISIRYRVLSSNARNWANSERYQLISKEICTCLRIK